jgi:hypothetical protein
MNGFEPLSQAGFGSLMQMLENIQRQGAIQKAAVGPTLGRGLEGMLQGFQRQGDIRRQQEAATARQGMAEAGRARQATVDYNRQRGMDREERGFRERLAQMRGPAGAPNYDKMIIGLEGQIAEGKLYGSDTSGLQRELDRLRGMRGDTSPAPAPGGPGAAAPVDKNTPKTYADVAAERQAKVAKKAENDKARETLRAGVAADVEKMLLAQTPEGDPKIAKSAADKIGRIMSEEGEPLIMVAGSTQSPKSREGKLLNMALRLQTRGVPDREIIRQVMAAAKAEQSFAASSRAKQGLKPIGPLAGREYGTADLTPADVFTFLQYMGSTIK